MNNKPKNFQFFTDRNTALGQSLMKGDFRGVMAKLPDQLSAIHVSFSQAHENLLGRTLPLAEMEVRACLDQKDPYSLLKDVVAVFESILLRAIDHWTKTGFIKHPISMENLIKKINQEPNYLRDIALTLKTVYDAYPAHEIFRHKEQLESFVTKIEPYMLLQPVKHPKH